MTEDTIRYEQLETWREHTIPSEAEIIHAEMEGEDPYKLHLWYRVPTDSEQDIHD